MLLTPEHQKALARKAAWYFDVYFGMTTADSVVFPGDGVDDLDALISRIETARDQHNIGVNSRFLVDLGASYSDWRKFDLEDLYAIRGYYVEIYGNVKRPAVLERENLIAGSGAVSN